MRGILLTGALCALSTAAWADPPLVGQKMMIEQVFVCDTHEQVKALYDAAKADGGRGVAAKYHEYNELIDKAGEPTCNVQPVMGSSVRSVEDVGKAVSPGGHTVHGWLIEIVSADGSRGWVLYGERGPREFEI
jgi:hypothetical protein